MKYRTLCETMIFLVSPLAFWSFVNPELTSDPIVSFLQRNVNADVSPCENFYRHVCPKNIQKNETIQYTIVKYLKDLNKEDGEHFKYIYPFLSSMSVSNKNILYIKYLLETLSWQRLFHTNSKLRNGRAKMMEMFQELFEEYLRVVTESEWVANHIGRKVAEQKLRSAVHLFNHDMSQKDWDEIQKLLSKVEERIKNCFVSYPEDKCVEKASEIVSNNKFRAMFTKNKIEKKFNEYNARNDEGEVIIYFPLIYAGSLENQAHVFGTIGFAISHEIGHSIGTQRSSALPYITNHTDCIVKHMENVCKRQDEVPVEYCGSGRQTLREDVTDSPSLRRTIQVFKNKFNPTVKQMQDFFYAVAAISCDPYTDRHDGHDPHSIPGIRTNAQLMQIDDFAEVFNCHPDDFMTISRAEKCHLYGEDAGADKKFRKTYVN